VVPFDKDTEQQMEELFRDKKCCKCDRKANRLCQGQFYCFDCFDRRTKDPYTIPTAKDHSQDRI
jgi:hypothetical protein